jgi:hypothetical protein
VKSPDLQRATSHSRCSPAILRGHRPPILSGAALPVARTRFTQPIAVLAATPKRFAARRHDSPPGTTAADTRSRKSIE